MMAGYRTSRIRFPASRQCRVPAILLILAISCGCFGPLEAQEGQESKTLQKIREGIRSSFSFPIRDLFEKEHSSEWRNLLSDFSGGVSFNYPLEKIAGANSSGRGSEGERATNASFAYSLKFNPISYWFINATFLDYVDPDLQQPWNPDFTYVFGYDDWHPYTFSLIYSNYVGNRLNPDPAKNERHTRFEEGTFSLAWKFIVPPEFQRLFGARFTSNLRGSIGLDLTPRYFDLDSGRTEQWKKVLNLSFKYTIYKWWYINFSFFFYPDSSSQQPWNPDFTWGLGYFDWHPGTISLQYNNYSGNRFPWSDNIPGAGRFRDGSISISWSWKL